MPVNMLQHADAFHDAIHHYELQMLSVAFNKLYDSHVPISINDELPEDGKAVIVLSHSYTEMEDSYFIDVCIYKDEKFMTISGDTQEEPREITPNFWMPLIIINGFDIVGNETSSPDDILEE